MEAKDFAGAMAALESAIALRPDFPQLFLDLARAYVAAERFDDAVGALQRYARFGLHASVDKSEDFVALRSRKDFQEVSKALAANVHPKGDGEIAFTLRDVTGLIEGIAWSEKTGEFYFSDVHHRAVWTRNKDGSLKRFTPEGDELLGVFGLGVDEANATLWAATLVPFSEWPFLLGLTDAVYAVGALVLGLAQFGTALRFLRHRSEVNARVLFYASITYLPLLWALMVLGKR